MRVLFAYFLSERESRLTEGEVFGRIDVGDNNEKNVLLPCLRGENEP